MKSSTQVFASLVAALATLSQSAVATPSSRVMSQNAIDWQHSSLSVASQATIKDSGQSSSRSFRVADRAVIIDADAISVGSKNRTTILKCSESQPCIEDLLVIDSYKETFGSDGKIEGASIVMYNTSYAPTAIEVYNSKGEFKSVGFVDGKKGGFKDLGDFLKTAASGIVEPFACVMGKGYQQCLNDLKNGKYEIARAEKQLKLQAGDVVRISRGSESARFYAHALQGLDMVDSLISSSEIVKKDPITLKKNFSPELKRKIIEGYIKKKMNDKYTWGMLLKEFGYERNKKAIGNNLDLFNSSLEVAKNIPEDFRKAIIDGTVASKVAGDGLSLLIESTSKKASIFLDSTLLLSQLTNIYVRSSSSEAAYKNPYPLVIAYEKPIKDKTPRVPVRFPDESSSMPVNPMPRQLESKLPRIGFVKNTHRVSEAGHSACFFWPVSVPEKESSKKIIVFRWDDKAVMNFNGQDTILFKAGKSGEIYQAGKIQIELKGNKNRNYSVPFFEGIVVVSAGKYSKTIQYHQMCDD